MAATEPITFDELLQAMEAAGGGAEGFTVAELCERQHIGCVRARNIVRDAIRRGELRPARKWITDISGMRKPVPSYVFVKQAKRR